MEQEAVNMDKDRTIEQGSQDDDIKIEDPSLWWQGKIDKLGDGFCFKNQSSMKIIETDLSPYYLCPNQKDGPLRH